MTQPSFPIHKKFGYVDLLVLKGSRKEMGIQYGKIMAGEMQETLDILLSHYSQEGILYEQLLAQAELYYNRYTYKKFTEGMAEGSGMSLDHCKILLAMETLAAVTKSTEIGQCSFLFLPPSQTDTGSSIIGRNYDYFKPFDLAAKYLTVTILHETDKIPTALLSMPGQIYCSTCINSENILIELNNGMPSGGTYVDIARDNIFVHLFEIAQTSRTIEEVQAKMFTRDSDYSLIINAADNKSTQSYEFSTTLGKESHFPLTNTSFCSTNYYQSADWQGIPNPNDENTWQGVTRKNNLSNLASNTQDCNIDCFKSLMDKTIVEGGAVWDYTIFQVLYDTAKQDLYLKINGADKEWVFIPLKEYFSLLQADLYADQPLRTELLHGNEVF